MTTKSTIEKLAFPMFISGILAMIASATISVSTTASATSPVEYKKITLNYLSSGYSASDSSCGNYSDLYSGTSFNDPTFRARSSNGTSSDKLFTCSVTLYVVTDVDMPTPAPAPTRTIIYKPEPWPTPTTSPTRRPSPTPTATTRPTKTPTPTPTWWLRPTPLPTKAPRP